MFFVSSCSHLTKKNLDLKVNYPQKAMSSLCRESDGQAFLKFKELEHSLSFQSKFSASPSKWDLIFDIPFKGEENLLLTTEPVRLSGSIFEKIESQYLKLKQINEQIYLDATQELDALKNTLALFLNFTLQKDYTNCLNSGVASSEMIIGSCSEFVTWQYKSNDEFILTFKKPYSTAKRHLSHPKLVTTFKKLDLNKYSEMQLSYYPDADSSDLAPMLQIDLNNETCQK